MNSGDRVGTPQDRAGHDVGWLDGISLQRSRERYRTRLSKEACPRGIKIGNQKRSKFCLVENHCLDWDEPESGADLWMGSEFPSLNRCLHRDELERGQFVIYW